MPFGLLGAMLMMGIGAGAAFGDTPDIAVVESDPTSVPSGFGTASVTCPPGRLASGGGFGVTPATAGVPLIASQPLPGAAGWTVSITNTTANPLSLVAFALCAAVASPGSGPAGLTGASGPQGLTAAAGAVGATGATGERGPQGERGVRGPRGLGAAGARALTRARCLALRKARRALPGACATRFKVRPVAR